MKEIINTALKVAPLVVPLAMQVALNIVNQWHILLVKDPKTSRLTPHYWKTNRYIPDPYWEQIKPFVMEEAVRLFTYQENPTAFSEIPVQQQRFEHYQVPEKELEKYHNDVAYVERFIKAVVNAIKGFAEIQKDADAFDSDAYMVNAQNGVFDIQHGELLPHAPSMLFRNVVNAQYVNTRKVCIVHKNSPQSTLRGWELFYKVVCDALYDKKLNEIENRKIVDSFLQILASFLIGNNKLKLVYILIGKPNTGKTTLENVLRAIFADYATEFNNGVLLHSPRRDAAIRPEIIALRGKRLLIGSESGREDKFDAGLVKKIAGNDGLSFRNPFGTMENFTIVGKLMLGTNFCPNFTDLEDQAFLNRLVLVDFNNIPGTDDKELKEKILTDSSRDEIFSHLADIAHTIANTGEIFIADRFKANKERLLVNQNSTVAKFFREHIRPGDGECTVFQETKHPVHLLYSAMYVPFCKSLDVKPLSLEQFGKEFRRLTEVCPAVELKRGSSNNYYIGFEVIGGNKEAYDRALLMDFLDKNRRHIEDERFV